MIDYSPLWHTMEEKQISQYVLLKSGIDHKTLDRLKKNSNITALTLEKLCLILDCQPNDEMLGLTFNDYFEYNDNEYEIVDIKYSL